MPAAWVILPKLLVDPVLLLKTKTNKDNREELELCVE